MVGSSRIDDGVGESDPVVSLVELCVVFAHEDVSQDPPGPHGEVKVVEAGDALGLTLLGDLEAMLVFRSSYEFNSNPRIQISTPQT